MHQSKRVLLVENPNAGARDKQVLLYDLREGLLSAGFSVEQESEPEKIRQHISATSRSEEDILACVTVSYTHLTLPTKA